MSICTHVSPSCLYSGVVNGGITPVQLTIIVPIPSTELSLQHHQHDTQTVTPVDVANVANWFNWAGGVCQASADKLAAVRYVHAIHKCLQIWPVEVHWSLMSLFSTKTAISETNWPVEDTYQFQLWSHDVFVALVIAVVSWSSETFWHAVQDCCIGQRGWHDCQLQPAASSAACASCNHNHPTSPSPPRTEKVKLNI